MLFQIYKKKQGQIVRWINFAVWSLLFLYGTYRLYFFLGTWQWAIKHKWLRFIIPLLDIEVVVDPRLLIGIAGGIFCLWVIFYLTFQKERTSEFLIDTESEMRKVSWPTVSQVVKFSIAVILIVVILSVYLYVVDGILDPLLSYIFR